MRLILTFSFLALVPLTTFILLYLKGIPTFAEQQIREVILWVYGVTWMPALVAGLLVSTIVSGVTHRTDYFHRPYDFGRCFSLGAIAGALSEALATWMYRIASHRPFSGFWIAGAMIAGCLVGAFLTSLVLGLYARSVKP
jgi:hypothetical protein